MSNPSTPPAMTPEALKARINQLERIVPSELDGEERWNRNGEYVRLYDVIEAIDLLTSAQPAPAQEETALRHAVRDFLHPYKHGTKPWTQLDEADLVAFIQSLSETSNG